MSDPPFDAPLSRLGKIAVIGAGVAGMACAQALRAGGRRVEIFEKSRGVGGRCATRRPFGRDDPLGIDHGAPYAETTDPETAAALAACGVVWKHPGAPHGAVVGRPGMRDLAAAIGRDADGDGPAVRAGVEIAEIARGAEDWLLRDTTGAAFGPFAGVAVAIPAPQAAGLLGDACPDVTAAEMAPCWTLLLALPAGLDAPSDVMRPVEGPIEVAIRNSAKPERSTAAGDRALETWVAHAHADWSAAHLEREKDEMAAVLSAAVGDLFSAPPPTPLYRAAHRWRYARTARPVGKAFWLSDDGALGCCGDWRLGPTVGDAFRSGDLLGRAMARKLTDQASQSAH